MKDALSSLIAVILQDMGIADARVEVEVPEDAVHGDYTTNVAMKIWRSPQSPQTPKSPQFSSPMEIALQVVDKLKAQSSKLKANDSDQNIGKRGHPVSPQLPLSSILSAIDHIEVVPPGFINVFLTEASLSSELVELLKSAEAATTVQEFIGNWKSSREAGSRFAGEIGHSRRSRVMVEYAHPNTHKAFHIGHLRNITTGESIIHLLESQGNTVIRANYQGDVGMHIAKALYGLLRNSKLKAQMSKLKTATEKVEFLGKAYAAGSKAFEEDPSAKEEIGEINKKIYAKEGSVYPLYRETRQWSLDYFDAIYKRVGSHFDRFYFESEVYEAGKQLVFDGLKKGIFEESDGAIIFPGKKYGLHNRVFVTGEGNATYEGKELALASMETSEHGKIDRLIHVVGPEQTSFFQVTFKAEELLGIVKPGVQYHLIYGWVKLKHGKMSSRSGNVVLGEWLLDESKKAIYNILERNTSKDKSLDTSDSRDTLDPLQRELIAEKAAIAAVKYTFLKVGTTSEIAFDIKESVNFQGDSGPYLQYTYARCKSVLRKSQIPMTNDQQGVKSFDWILDIGHCILNSEERAVLRLLIQFPDVVSDAAEHLSPSTLATYLFKLAQAFNLFYAKHSILGNQESGIRNQGKKGETGLFFHDSKFMIHDSAKLRLALTAATAHVLKSGLYLLGIETLEQM